MTAVAIVGLVCVFVIAVCLDRYFALRERERIDRIRRWMGEPHAQRYGVRFDSKRKWR